MGAFLALAQAAVYGALAWTFRDRWAGDAGLLALAAAAQLVAGAGVASASPRAVRVGAVLSLVAVLVVWLRFAWVAAHVRAVFGPDTGGQMMQTLGASLVALPWVLAVPIGQLWVHRVRVAPAALFLLPAPWLFAEPAPPLVSPVELDRLGAAMYRSWAAGEAPPATEARVRVTPLRDGAPGPTVEVESGSLAPAVPAGPPGPEDALLVEVATGEVPLGLLRPGVDAPLEPPRSAALVALKPPRREVLPGLMRPAAERSLRFEGALVTGGRPEDVIRLDSGWAPGPEVGVGSVRSAVNTAVGHLVANLREDGRYTYIVKGPSGAAGDGYNYPRHAGTTWFLARAAVAYGNTRAADAARRALAHLDTVTRTTDDGRAFVLDPARRDGKAWAGTTALAVMARATLAGDDAPADEALRAGVRLLASVVDEAGAVRGELRVDDGTIPEQPQNPYGQGQVMLALAIAERHGVTDGAAALDRAIAFVNGRYFGVAAPLAVADEHWMCLANHAVRSVRGVDAGAAVCRTYVAQEAWNTPAGGGLDPATAPAGGAAEAVVAWARDSGDRRAREQSLALARHFLRNQYHEEDAGRLGDARRLVGGFRGAPGDLDVQIDGVQHVACALMGVEALLTGRDFPGAFP